MPCPAELRRRGDNSGTLLGLVSGHGPPGGREPVIVDTGIEQDFKITPDQLEAAITVKPGC